MDTKVNPFEADSAVTAKVRRIAAGNAIRVLDLFSGCGGLSLGFHRAGFEISGAVEIDPHAARSHALNFHGSDPDIMALHAKARDITTIEPEDLCAEFGLGPTADAVDVLVGGPPCQSYARIGRAKLADLANNPEAYMKDTRRNLYLTYIRWMDRLRPLAILIENVPDMLNQGGHNVAAEIVKLLDGHGYVARYGLVNAAFYGVPQLRDRAFIIAYRKELGRLPVLPVPTRYVDLPSGYHGSRSVALKYVDLFGIGAYITVSPDRTLPDAVTVEQAISDLPELSGDGVKCGTRRPGAETWMPYRVADRLSDYAIEMRQWPGFEASAGIQDHLIRALPRDGHIFEAMREGAQYPEAHEVAAKLFRAEAVRQRIRKGSKKWIALQQSMVPPYTTETFPNRWRKLVRDAPSHTLTAHLGKDCYSHIHYDSSQRRTISIREAARLSSFPDGFVFAGTMNPSFRQIGNAVPPLVAFEMAKIMKVTLEDAAAEVVCKLIG